jgi:hypothetical protein
MRARERKILLNGFSAMFLREDVVDLKRQREGKLRNQAVLATTGGATPDPSDKRSIHCVEALSVVLRSLLALDCMIPSRLPM